MQLRKTCPEEPCITVKCEYGFELVGTDKKGCGGECMVKLPCIMVDCEPGFDLVGTDNEGCGGECVKKAPQPCGGHVKPLSGVSCGRGFSGECPTGT